MLQIIIVHEPNSLYISEVRDLEEMKSLAVFNEEKNCIDLSSLENHIGETILVTHFNRDKCTRLDYEHEKTLTAVGTDENGFMYVQYN
jgi:hypothetical protein